MKKLTLIIFLGGILNCYSQKNPETIVGIWKLEEVIDLRTLTEKEKSNEPQIIKSDENYETFLKLTENRKIEYNNVEFGEWEIKKDTLLFYRKVSKKKNILIEKLGMNI